MEETVIASAVTTVASGSPLFEIHRCFLTPGDAVFACAIRVQNGCVFLRTLIRPYVPEMHELAVNFNTCPQGWKFAGVGNPQP